MLPLSDNELARWRCEIDYGVKFRDEEFGTYKQRKEGDEPDTTLAGENLEYFERGGKNSAYGESPLNLVFPIVKNIVPSLIVRNPRVSAIPLSRHSVHPDDAFYAAELINADLRDTDFAFKDTAQMAVFDSYVLGYGVVKIGYTSKFGQDILPTKQEKTAQLRDKLKQLGEQIKAQLNGKPSETEPEKVGPDSTIISENAYVQWISPFDFVIDPRARSLNDARWVAQRIRRTLREIKNDRRYSRERFGLRPEAMEDAIPDSAVEDFQTADVWEIHYKEEDSPTGVRVLTIAITQKQNAKLMHENSEYDLAGWQYEWLVLNKHGHRLYPVSTVSVIRPLIDRINSSFAVILEQVDKFQSKIVHNARVGPSAKNALQSSELGALVELSGEESVSGAVAMISMEQVKTDMLVFMERVLDLVILITGLTRAQLTGLTTAQTATEAQIGQSGQNLRRADEIEAVSEWGNRVLNKLWRVKAQFEDLEDIDLVQESGVVQAQTGVTETAWFPAIDPERAERLRKTKMKFHIELGSMQKPNPEIIRAQLEAFFARLMNPIVTQGLALEGKRLSASEIIKQWSKSFEEYGFANLSKIIVPVTDPNQQAALASYGIDKPNGRISGPSGVPSINRANVISAAAGEKGMGASPA